MKYLSKLALVAAALGASACLTSAQENTRPPAHRPHPAHPAGAWLHQPPIVATLDANGDGILDAAELAAAPAQLAKLDQDGDGNLSLAELAPSRPGAPRKPGAPRPPRPPGHLTPDTGAAAAPGETAAGPGGGAPPPPPPPWLVAVLDANQDGVIDADETANATPALKILDTNADGQLTTDEYGPPRRSRNEPEHRPGPPDHGHRMPRR